MFDIAPSEFLLVAFVALVVIGPKDLPKAMRVVGYWVGRARAVGRQFRAGFDEMVREAELEEMEKKWKAENERIMREHPAIPPPAADALAAEDGPVEMEPPRARHQWVETPRVDDADQGALPLGDEQKPVMVEQPRVVPGDEVSAPQDKAAS
jgi:sec-independent protein translocase protein TatB